MRTQIEEIIKRAIAEDLGDGDHSSLSCIPIEAMGKAQLKVKEKGVLAGVELAKWVFNLIDPKLKVEVFISDGAHVKPGDIAFYVSGPTRSILAAERTALNFMQRMSGIATSTDAMVTAMNSAKCKLLDTRKTTPGIRIIEKWAVRIGGGLNHRMGLFDMIMLKDNHIDFAGGIEKAITRTHEYLKTTNKTLKIEVEVRTLEDVEEVLRVRGVDRIMLDNFTPQLMKEAVDLIQGKFETEASGMINLSNIKEYASTGVDFISSGSLTHQIKSLDLSLKSVI
ncbi:MAG: carboxylating nicotinate-nucleotide diphosphorylase [Bacteroidota bacterium]